jgi:hypothetical protein
MADELKLEFALPERPDQVLAAWRTAPPVALREGGYELMDESYNSLTWRSTYTDVPGKIMNVVSLGLMKGFLESNFTLTARFDAGERGGTRVTMLGTAHPNTREALLAFVEQQTPY